jgi:glycosyltransferase involved in cell wall biosynthesis
MPPDAPGALVKLLVLSPVFPDAPSDGDRLRLFHWIAELGQGHEIHLACFTDPARPEDQGPGALGRGLRAVHRVAWPRPRRLMAAGLRLFSAAPSGVAALASRSMRGLVDSLLETAQGSGAPFDAVLAYRLKMAPYALRFKGPRFLDYTDSMTRYTERRAVELASQRRPLAAAFARAQAARLAAYEAWCAGEFDAGFFNAVQDCEAVRSMRPRASAGLQVAANGVDAALFKGGRKGAARNPHELLFVGHLAYPPNADAVAWFVRLVLPLVRAKVPEAFLTVLGGDAPAGLAALKGAPGLRFAGFVKDTLPYLDRAALSVCPVRTGAGRQNKLLEAFAAGLPAVATSLSAQGAEALDGVHLMVADEAPAFASAVVRLLEHPERAQRLSDKARGLARARYLWPRNAAILESAMLKATRRPLW